jgi:hypothetical protein
MLLFDLVDPVSKRRIMVSSISRFQAFITIKSKYYIYFHLPRSNHEIYPKLFTSKAKITTICNF